MTSLESLMNSIKLSTNQEKKDYIEPKMFSSDTNQFSTILESANKSYNFTYEKVSDKPFSFVSQDNTFKEESFLNKIVFQENTNTNKETGISSNVINNTAYTANDVNKNTELINQKENNNNKIEYTTKEKKTQLDKVDKKDEKQQEHIEDKGKNHKTEDIVKEKNTQPDKVDKKATQNLDTLLMAVVVPINTIPIHTVQIEKKTPEVAKLVSNVTKNQENNDNVKINIISNPHNQPEKVLNNKSKQHEDKKSAPPENNASEVKKVDKNILNALESKQKPENDVQKQEVKKESDVKINVEILKNTNLDHTKTNNDTKLKPEMVDDLKLKVIKLQVENIDNKELDLNSNNSGSKALNFNNIESQVTKLNIDKSAGFDNALNQTNYKTPVNEANVLEQVYKKTTEQFKQNKSEITIALTPERLGKVDVNLISEKGSLTAQFIAESNQAKDILTKGLEALKQNLQDQGVNVNNIVVKVQEPAQSENSQFTFDKDFNQKFGETNQNASNSNSSDNSHNSSNSNELFTDSNIEIENDEFISREISKENVSHNGSIDYRI